MTEIDPRTRPDAAAIAAALARLFRGRPVRRVLLVNPPDVEAALFNFETCRRKRYTNYEPYGLGCLASQLRLIGVEVHILNLNNSVLRAGRLAESPAGLDYDRVWRTDLATALAGFAPELVGVTCMFTQTHPMFARVCAEVAACAPGLPVAVGGVHVTNSLASASTRGAFLASLPAVPLLFRHECDDAFPQFVEVVNGRLGVDRLAQVLIRTGDGTEIDIAERARPEVGRLDVTPAHDLMDPVELSRWGKVGSYFYLKPESERFATVLGSRGCRGQCTFCSVRNFNGVGVRRRSVGSVIEELKRLSQDYGVGHVMWLDDDFLYDRAQSLALFDAMVRARLPLTWDCTNGVIAASCTDEVIDAAAASGCIGLSVGMETGNRDMLRRIRKPGTVENFLAAAEAIRRHPEIYTRVFLIIGFPGETFAQISDTVTVARTMGLDWYQIQVLQPLPNTPIFDRMVEDGLIAADDFGNVRYSGGVFGKNAKRSEQGRDMLARDFKDLFARHDPAATPGRDELDDAWAYMVFHLNYLKLAGERRPVKLVQYLQNLEYITDVVALGDAFALHFRIELLKTLGRPVEPALAERLRRLLAQQPYWLERFADFGLVAA